MGDRRGIGSINLDSHVGVEGVVPFKVAYTTIAGTSTYQVFPNGSPFGKVRVIGMSGIMSGAGAAADTVQLQDGSSNAITEAVDVSALSAGDKWDASQVSRTYYEIQKGDNLKIATVSGALSEVWVELVRVDDGTTVAV